MDWYVLKTLAGKEDAVFTYFKRSLAEFKIIYPKRRIGWRKNGRVISIIRPLFEGYLFVSTDEIEVLDSLLRRHSLGIAWLIRNRGILSAIYPDEKQIIEKLMNSGGIVEASEIQLVGNRIEVVTGPLVGLEHVIKKFSGKNRRIITEFSILGESREVEFEGNIIKSEKYCSYGENRC